MIDCINHNISAVNNKHECQQFHLFCHFDQTNISHHMYITIHNHQITWSIENVNISSKFELDESNCSRQIALDFVNKCNP